MLTGDLLRPFGISQPLRLWTPICPLAAIFEHFWEQMRLGPIADCPSCEHVRARQTLSEYLLVYHCE